jgi:ATP-dependent DNA ligase
MTDNAMWVNSNLVTEESGPNVYLPNAMLGPPLETYFKCLLADNYKEEMDPVGWIMSEKLDGLRCLWTGN